MGTGVQIHRVGALFFLGIVMIQYRFLFYFFHIAPLSLYRRLNRCKPPIQHDHCYHKGDVSVHPFHSSFKYHYSFFAIGLEISLLCLFPPRLFSSATSDCSWLETRDVSLKKQYNNKLKKSIYIYIQRERETKHVQPHYAKHMVGTERQQAALAVAPGRARKELNLTSDS